MSNNEDYRCGCNDGIKGQGLKYIYNVYSLYYICMYCNYQYRYSNIKLNVILDLNGIKFDGSRGYE